MVTANKFEDLIAWQFSTELCELVFRLTESGKCLSDPEFCDQIRRAAENAPALIGEGFIRYTPDEFVRYLRMARGEIGEVQSRLAHAGARRYFSDEEWQQATKLARSAMALTTALLKSKLPLLKKHKRQPGASPR
jgi:four helix bundle protein